MSEKNNEVNTIKITVSKTDPKGFFLDVREDLNSKYKKDSFHQNNESLLERIKTLLNSK